MLTHVQHGLGALLLSVKLILGICTELFIVKAPLIPECLEALGKNIAVPGRQQSLQEPPKEVKTPGFGAWFSSNSVFWQAS